MPYLLAAAPCALQASEALPPPPPPRPPAGGTLPSLPHLHLNTHPNSNGHTRLLLLLIQVGCDLLSVFMHQTAVVLAGSTLHASTRSLARTRSESVYAG